MEQFLFDHGDNENFIDQYGHIDLCSMTWTLQKFSATELLDCSVYPPYRDRIDNVCGNLRWMLHTYRRNHGSDVFDDTWRVPPVFIDGSLLKPEIEGIHLVEGHSRNGMLKGLFRDGEVNAESEHEVWFGESEEAGSI